MNNMNQKNSIIYLLIIIIASLSVSCFSLTYKNDTIDKNIFINNTNIVYANSTVFINNTVYINLTKIIDYNDSRLVSNLTDIYYNFLRYASPPYLFVNTQTINFNESVLNNTAFHVCSAYNDTSLILSINTTSNIQSLGFYNSTYLDPFLLVGGNRIYWFTNQTNVAGNKNMTLITPMNTTIKELNIPIASNTVTLASFITQKVTGNTVFSAGMRHIYLNLRNQDVNRQIEIQAFVTRCINYNESSDTCQSNSMFSISSTAIVDTTSSNIYMLQYFINNTYFLNSSDRFIVTINATKIFGAATNILFDIDDMSYSRIEVPSPVGVTDITGKLDITDQRYNDTSLILGVNSSLTNMLNTKYNSSNPANYQNDTQVNDSIYQALASTSVVYVPVTIQTLTGTNTSGNVASVQAILDSNTYNISEVNGVPGFEIRMNYTNITRFTNIEMYLYYNGLLSHTIDVDLWNYNTSSWDTIGTFSNMVGFTYLTYQVIGDSTRYINNSKVQQRLYHITTGSNAHNIYIDYSSLKYSSGAVSSGVQGSGNTGTLAKWASANTLTFSTVSETSSLVTVSNNLNVTGNISTYSENQSYSNRFIGNINGSYENSIYNINTGNLASVNWCFYNDLVTNDVNFNCIGTNGVNYNDSNYASQKNGDMFLESSYRDIHLDVKNSTQNIEMYVGGVNPNNIKLAVNSNNISIYSPIIISNANTSISQNSSIYDNGTALIIVGHSGRNRIIIP